MPTLGIGVWCACAFVLVTSASAQPRPEPDPSTPAGTDPSAVAQDARAPEPDSDADDDELDPLELDPVYVFETTGDELPRAASERRFDAETLALTPADTAEDYLELAPGVLIVQHGSEGKGHQFYLRGFDAAHGSDVAITLERIPLNEMSNVHGHGYVDLAFIVPEAIAGLTVRKGSFELAQRAFATAGQVDFELGVPDDLRGYRAGVGFETTDRYRLVGVFAPPTGHEHDVVAIEAVHDSGFGPNRLTERASGIGQWVVYEDRARDVRLEVLGSGYVSRFGLPGTLRLDDQRAGRIDFIDAYPDSRDTDGLSARALAALQLAVDGEILELDAMVYGGWRRLDLEENFTGDLFYPDHGDRRRQAQDERFVGLDLDAAVGLASWLELRALAGVTASFVDQLETRLEREPPHPPWQTARDLNLVQVQSHAALGVEIDPLDERLLVLDAGARLDVFAFPAVDDDLDAIDEVYTDTLLTVSPRTTLSSAVHDDLTLFAGYGRGVRPPEARSVVPRPADPLEPADVSRYAGGAPDITVADSAELGARWQPFFAQGDVALEVGVAAFGTWIEREAIYDHVSGINLERNGSRRLGLELDAAVRPLDWLEVSGDLTWVDTEFDNTGNAVPGVPTLLGNLRVHLQDRASGLYGSTRLLGMGPRPLPNGATTSSLAVVDLLAGVRTSWVQLQFGIENVLGSEWREGEYQFASHRDPDTAPSQIPVIHYVPGSPRTLSIEVTAWF